MGALIVIALVIIVGLVGFVQIAARHETDLHSPLSQADAASIVAGSFGALWKPVDGPGNFNYKPKLRQKAPILSINVVEQPNGSEVQMWVSSGVTNYGLLLHAQLMWRKKLATARKITAASEQTALPIVQPQTAPSINRLG